MKKLMIASMIGIAMSGSAFAQNTVNVPSDRQVQPSVAPDAAQRNPMPGKTGGFNNDEINGKSRNPNSTTPNTGPTGEARQTQ